MSLAVTYNAPSTRFLTGPERAAAIVLAMGPVAAQKVLKFLDEDHLKVLMKTASNLGQISHSQITGLVDDFIESFSNGSDVVGTPSEVHKLLNGILPKEQMDGLMDELHGNANRSVWERISSVSDSTIASYLSREHPQTAAFILSKIHPNAAAKALTQLPPAFRSTVTNRMLSLKPIIDDTAKSLEAALQENFITNFSRDATTDTHSRMAKIINKMDRDSMELVLADIAGSKPKSVEILKSMLFTFDDIVKLTPRDRETLLNQVSLDVLAIALRSAADTLRDTILSALSARTRKVVENDMALAEGISAKEISDARRSITDLALELANRDEITMPSSSEGDLSGF